MSGKVSPDQTCGDHRNAKQQCEKSSRYERLSESKGGSDNIGQPSSNPKKEAASSLSAEPSGDFAAAGKDHENRNCVHGGNRRRGDEYKRSDTHARYGSAPSGDPAPAGLKACHRPFQISRLVRKWRGVVWESHA
jgi:hypothetical protein